MGFDLFTSIARRRSSVISRDPTVIGVTRMPRSVVAGGEIARPITAGQARGIYAAHRGPNVSPLLDLRYFGFAKAENRTKGFGSPFRYLTCTVERWLNTFALTGAKPEQDQRASLPF
jgi:hypothetical protein